MSASTLLLYPEQVLLLHHSPAQGQSLTHVGGWEQPLTEQLQSCCNVSGPTQIPKASDAAFHRAHSETLWMQTFH